LGSAQPEDACPPVLTLWDVTNQGWVHFFGKGLVKTVEKTGL
jgi:hypothetical protein